MLYQFVTMFYITGHSDESLYKNYLHKFRANLFIRQIWLSLLDTKIIQS